MISARFTGEQGVAVRASVARGGAVKPRARSSYFDFGQLVNVGHQFAAVRLLGVRLSGFVAWFVWRSLYLSKLVGFGNKLRVMLDWTWELFVTLKLADPHHAREASAVHRHDSAHEQPRNPTTSTARAA